MQNQSYMYKAVGMLQRIATFRPQRYKRVGYGRVCRASLGLLAPTFAVAAASKALRRVGGTSSSKHFTCRAPMPESLMVYWLLSCIQKCAPSRVPSEIAALAAFTLSIMVMPSTRS